jgi:hypothetical protein
MTATASGPSYTGDDFIALEEDDLRELIDGQLVEAQGRRKREGSRRVTPTSPSRSSLHRAVATTA